MKRGWTLLFAITLILGALALPAGAQEIEVTDEATFAQALYDGGTVILQNDIHIADFVLVRENVTIDLNGHQILVAEGANGANIRHTNGCEMVIRDSVGTGKIGGGAERVFLNMECGSLRIEGGFVDRLLISGGDAELVSGTIDFLEFNSVLDDVTVIKHEGIQVNDWLCQRGTVNFDPTPYIKPGFAATDNGDGTYTITDDPVEKTGQTISYYYDAYSEKYGKFLLSEDGSAPRELCVEVLYVNAGESECIPMTKCDGENNRWVAEIDRAYIGMEMRVFNPDCGIATDFMVLTEDGTAEKVDKGNDASREPAKENGDGTYWVWIAVGAGVVAVILAVILLRKKK